MIFVKSIDVSRSPLAPLKKGEDTLKVLFSNNYQLTTITTPQPNK